jgi:Cobalamin adenosyltransferase
MSLRDRPLTRASELEPNLLLSHERVHGHNLELARLVEQKTRTLVSGWFSVLVQKNIYERGQPLVSTRRGDDGTTTLLGAGRLPKNDVRIALLGDVDEASSSLGLARAEADDKAIKELLLEPQRLLYRVMGDVAMPKEENIVGPRTCGGSMNRSRAPRSRRVAPDRPTGRRGRALRRQPRERLFLVGWYSLVTHEVFR